MSTPEASLGDMPAWQALEQHARALSGRHISDLFRETAGRVQHLTVKDCGLLVDVSKQRVDEQALALLCELAQQRQLDDWRARLFNGEHVNCTEDRPAMHWRLRDPDPDQAPEVHEQLQRMAEIVERIQSGQWRGCQGDTITDVLNVGVGGSELGPLMASLALSDCAPKEGRRPRLHFVSSMDGSQLSQVLRELDPHTTLVVVSSKSFTTLDTLSNAGTARQWLARAMGGDNPAMMRCHFIGISADAAKMSEWGIVESNQLVLWDWVGGRYSLWSVIGLSIALTTGMDGFREMLAGAHAMDKHFQSQPCRQNMAVLLALIDIWNVNFLGIPARAVLPYDGRLKHWPAYLEQLEMESNGKSVSRAGVELDYHTCPVIWGDVGPNAQHAFYQLLHQGTQPVACDFVMTARRYREPVHSLAAEELESQHDLANANCLAQSRLLAFGESALEDNAGLPHYKRYRGNQPSTTLVLDEMSPFTLGALVALYEHKVFVASVIWGVNPFDQWGVEMGKVMAGDLLHVLRDEEAGVSLDDSSLALIRHMRALRKQ